MKYFNYKIFTNFNLDRTSTISEQVGCPLSLIHLFFLLSIFLTFLSSTSQALDSTCTVAVLNRTAQVSDDGSWAIPNVPSQFGKIRARATCVKDGVTTSGQSDLFEVPANGDVNVRTISIDNFEPIPKTLQISSPTTILLGSGSSAQLSISGIYSDNSISDLTSGAAGTNYTTSNSSIVTVSPDGQITALASGTVVISATNDGAVSAILIQAITSDDSDGDGLSDDLELRVGLNPNDGVDGFEDLDNDGISNRDELIQYGTDHAKFDSDEDGIGDGEEIIAGNDGYITNPLLTDTDGDGISDGDEIALLFDPTNSDNLEGALVSISVSPDDYDLVVNSIIGQASIQLTVTGLLTNGSSIDLTQTSIGTNYSSNNLNICNFGAESGRVYAGQNGSCTISISNHNKTTSASIEVSTYTPTPLSFLTLTGAANNVEVKGDYAYVANSTTGLVVVDVKNKATPIKVTTYDTTGTAFDLVIVGNLLYLADGASGLEIFDISDPVNPWLLSVLDTTDAKDLVVQGKRAYLADGSAGLKIIDISDPKAPALLGSFDTLGTAEGVDLNLIRQFAVIADNTSGIVIVDIKNERAPTQLSKIDFGDSRDVYHWDSNTALVSDITNSLTSVDLSNLLSPTVLDNMPTNLGGRLTDLAVSGRFSLGADTGFINSVPIVDVSDRADLQWRALLDFTRLSGCGSCADDGTGIAVDGTYVYLTAGSRLYIGQYLAVDSAGIAPTVSILEPAPGSNIIEGSSIVFKIASDDDVGVARVEWYVGGVLSGTDSAPAYEFFTEIPIGVSTVTVRARAFDLGGNFADAEVIYTVIPDPRTTAIGRVVDSSGVPQSNAVVDCPGASGSTAADGTFNIPGVLTANPSIRCKATYYTSEFLSVSGYSAYTTPVQLGTTDFGIITVVATSVNWIGPASGGSWIVPSNWSSGAIPGANDDVVIDLVTVDAFVEYPSGTRTIRSLKAKGSVNFNGGSLTVNDSGILTSGILMKTGATFIVRGSRTVFDIPGNFNLQGGTLQAFNGAKINIPDATVISPAAAGFITTVIEANGANSKIDLPKISSITIPANSNTFSLKAIFGGELNLSLVSKIEVLGSSFNSVAVLSDGANSKIRFDSLDSFTKTSSAQIHLNTIEAKNKGEIVSPKLKTINSVVLTYNGDSFLDLSALSNMDGSSIIAKNGADLTLAGITSYACATLSGAGYGCTLKAENAKLNLPQLQTISEISSDSNTLAITAASGGSVSIPLVSKLETLDVSSSGTSLISAGVGSLVSMPSLVSITSQVEIFEVSKIDASSSGAIDLPSLTTIHDVTLNINSGGTLNLPVLSNIDYSSVKIGLGVVFSLPLVTSYSCAYDGFVTCTLSASGNGAQLSLPNLTTASVDTALAGDMELEATNGGVLDLGALITLETIGNSTSFGGRITVFSYLAGSLIDLSSLTSFIDNSSLRGTSLSATSGGSILTPSLLRLNKVDLTYSGSGTMDLSSVTNIDGSSITVSLGANLSLPGVTSYSCTGLNFFDCNFSASGSASSLDLSNLVSIAPVSGAGSDFNIQASSGGVIDLSALLSFSTTATNSGSIYLSSSFAGSNIILTSLQSVQSSFVNMSIFAGDGGSLETPSLVTLDHIDLDIDKTGSIDLSQVANINGTTITVRNGAVASLPKVTAIDNLPATGHTATLSASGTNSKLDLPNVQTITTIGATSNILELTATSGGVLNLPAVTQITSPVGSINGGVRISALSTGSKIDFSALTSIINLDSSSYNRVYINGSAKVVSPLLTILEGTELLLYSGATLDIQSLISFKNSAMYIEGAALNFANILDLIQTDITINSGSNLQFGLAANIDGLRIDADGGDINLPSALTYSSLNTGAFTISGSGKSATMTSLATIHGGTNSVSTFRVKALSGALFDLTGLTAVDGYVEFIADGTNSVIDLTNLQKTNVGPNVIFTEKNGGTIIKPF